MNFDGVEFLRWVYENAYPGLTYFFLLILAVLLQFTFSGHVTKKTDLSVMDHIISYLRVKLLVFYILLFVMFNCLVLIVALKTFGKEDGINYLKMIYGNVFDQSMNFSSILSLITVFLVPYLLHLIHRRFISPRISAWKRKYRVSQTGDTLSDIRVEKDKYASKAFDNRKYYKDGFIFMGLNQDEEPIYLPDEEFKSKNLKILGATQTGKGVIQQVLIDQSIWKGWGVWFMDQKPDDFIYSVMVQSCQHWNRDLPVVLDLTGESIGSYAPFEHGVLRERLQRFNKSFGLTGKGTDGDHYKGINRQVMTFLSDYWDGTLQHLDKLISGKDNAIPENKREWIFESTLNIRIKLDEWKLLPQLFPKKGEGFNVQKELEEASVVYIKGRQDDDLIREVCSSLLIEWKDCIIKKKHTKHIFAVLDEVKFCISPTVASALATVLSKDANMSLAYQERDDTKNIPDQSVDKDALKNQVETNTLITICYKCSFDTAEWIANNTGTIQKSTTRMEQVDTDGFGAEKWTGNRMIGVTEENYITTNSIQSLQKRVGVFMNNEGLAQYLFTSWIDVKEKLELPDKKKITQKEEKIINQGVINNSPVSQTNYDENEPKIDYSAYEAAMDNIPPVELEKETFNPEEDPEFVRMLSEKVKGKSPAVQTKKPAVNSSDLISSFGKNED
ncbi:triK protein [Yersinia aleksiciae]|uniref:triK protein n=1 Tax=Yersinia aleksiciae TaxID=263819 RepID=UPI00119DC6C9|nr:triK protein [Yersinia aleksiciae]